MLLTQQPLSRMTAEPHIHYQQPKEIQMTNLTNIIHHPAFKALCFILIILGLYVVSAELANAAGPFDGAKAKLQEELKHGGNLQGVLLMVSLVIGAVTGVMTKNWPAAIGTFVATELFLYVGSSLVFA